jgi:hypothetical protein
LRQLTQDLLTFNLEHYRELEGKFTLDDLRCFTEKAILRLGGSFIPSGDLVQITVPPALKKYPNVASKYENVTFSRKIATRKKNVDLLGIGHPLMDALIDYLKREGISGEVLDVKCDGVPSCLAARYLFTIDFEDGTKRELYKKFLLDGAELPEDLVLLQDSMCKSETPVNILSDLESKVEMLIRNEEAKIRSTYDGVINIRHKCVGIQLIN